jgi:hypothetical protein
VSEASGADWRRKPWRLIVKNLTDEQLEAMIEYIEASLEAQAQSAKVIEGEAEVVPSLPAPKAPKTAS